MPRILIPAIGYGIAAVLLWMLLNTQEKVGRLQEECNTRTAMAVAEAERVSRETLQAAHLKQLERLRQLASQEGKAKAAAEAAWLEAERKNEAAQAEIDRLIREAADENAPIEKRCLVTRVPADVISMLSQ